MPAKNSMLFYSSAGIAILAAVAYHSLVKKIPAGINPIVSVTGIYAAALVISIAVLPFVIEKGTLIESFQQLSWIQLALAVAVLGVELGFLLMYRYGWDLGTGNVVTGVFINIVLMGIGALFLREQLSTINIVGLIMCIAGVAMVGYRAS